jgi:hypothetical protein
MATCSNCGNEIREDVWVCGFCGEPVPKQTEGAQEPYGGYAYDEPVKDNDYYNAPTAYGTSAPTMSSGMPDTSFTRTWYIVGGAVLLILIMAVVWFFFLRDSGSADAFVGTWVPAASDQSTAVGNKIKIARTGDGVGIFFVDAKGAETGPFKAKMKGDKIETTLEYGGTDPQQKAGGEIIQAFLSAMVEDFKLVFYFEDDKLFLKVEGKPKEGLSSTGVNDPVELKKVQ